jgi:demethylmenaquinone methyltransferase/2-methoxy-6-polyprenyl-1,4-benzoquinol methylase
MQDTIQKSNTSGKSTYVNNLFSKIAKKYDLLNNLMTFGRHLKWKEDGIKLALKEVKDCNKALDLCTGTGDLSIILNKLSPKTEIIASDYCDEMLQILEKKIINHDLKNINVKKIDSESIDFPKSTFNLVTIGFGLRNLVNKEKCIESIYSVLKKDGVFMCIDLGHPVNPIWRKIFFTYFYNLVPKMGELFARDKDAYTYLPESLKTWYTQEELKEILLKKGFTKCFYKNIFGGVVAIHIAKK